MNIRNFLPILIILTISIYPGETAISAASDFIISGADAVEFVDTVGSLQLEDLIKGVTSRFVVQAANELRFYSSRCFVY